MPKKKESKNPPEKADKKRQSAGKGGSRKTTSKAAAQPAPPPKKNVGGIFETTDGFFNNHPQVTKNRFIAVVRKRRSDGALEVAKIYSKDGKEQKIGKDYIPDLELTPEEHKILSKVSIVGRETVMGVKLENNKFKPIFASDLTATDDKLTRKELKKVRKEIQNDTPQHRKTYKNKLKKWLKHFRK